jgi:hypothetical protein
MASTIAAMFDSALPALLSTQRARCAQIGGEYGFDIGGEGGGVWTLDFATAKVARGLPKKATLTIAMPASDFEKLLKGQLDVTAALRDRLSVRRVETACAAFKSRLATTPIATRA